MLTPRTCRPGVAPGPVGPVGFATRRALLVALTALLGAAVAATAAHTASAPAADFVTTCLADDYAIVNGGLAYCEAELANELKAQGMITGFVATVTFGLSALLMLVVTAIWDL